MAGDAVSASFGDSARTIAITGASGFIGAPLTAMLTGRGYRVLRIGRGPVASDGPDISWDPVRSTLDAASLEGVDAVIHLAGAPIAKRWTTAHRAAIRSSRVLGTELLSRTLAQLKRRPSVLVSGSAVGIYGSRGDTLLDESSAPGDDFLAHAAIAWEASTAPAADAGIRVVHARTGIVQHATGGALAKQLPLFRAGVGGQLGDGRQWVSPISLDDEIGALLFCVENEALAGAVNIVAPAAVTNAEFTEVLARILHRPAFARVPEFALRLALGTEMANLTVLASQRVVPARLRGAGYVYQHPTLESILQAALTETGEHA